MVPIGLWDTLKSGLATVGRAASNAWNWVKDKVSSAVETVRDWWDDRTTPVSQQLADSATRVLRSGVKATREAANQVWEAGQRLRRASEQRGEAARLAFVRQRAAALKEALALQETAIRKAAEAADLINQQKARVAELRARRIEQAREELAAARRVKVEVEDTLQELNRRALEEIVEKRDMLEGLSERTQNALAEFTRIQMPQARATPTKQILAPLPEGFELGEAAPIDVGQTLFMLGSLGSSTIASLGKKTAGQAERLAAARIRNVLSKKGITLFVTEFKKNPKPFMKNLLKMQPDDLGVFLTNLSKSAAAKPTYNAILRNLTDDVAKTLPRAQQITLKKAIAVFGLGFIGTLVAAEKAVSKVQMLAWNRKETTEPLPFAMSKLINAGLWRDAENAYEMQKVFLREVKALGLDWVLDKIPAIGRLAEINFNEQWMANEAMKKVIDRGKITNPEPTAVLTVNVYPGDANVQVGNRYMGKGGLKDAPFPPGTYTVLVYLKGWVSNSGSVTLVEGGSASISLRLTPSPTQTFKKWKKTTPKERQRLKTWKPRSYTYWQRSTPKQKTYYQDNYEKPRKEWTEPMRKQWEPWENEMEENGTITIRSTPAADIYMGGIDTGKTTPATFTLGPGTYDIRLETPGYEPWTGKVFLKAGEDEVIQAELISRDPTEREKTRGYVSVVTDPLGAWVFIDGVVSDYPTPTKLELEPGSYVFKIVKTGYLDLEFQVDVAAGETIRIEETLSPEAEGKVWRVYVNSTPSGGKILVDGFFSGSWTDGYVDLLQGTYTISVQKTGFKEASQTVEVGQ